MKIILISFLISIQAFADPISLSKDQKAPYDGILFTETKANEIRKEILDKDYLQLQNDSLNRSLDLYKSNENLYGQQTQLLLDQNDKLAKSLYQERMVTNWERLGFFLLGIGVTGLAIYGASQLAK